MESIHKNHRNRMREKFKSAPGALADHELLEMILYYAIPRINTNSHAHKILELAQNRLEGVLELEPSKIMQIEGMGESTATYFMLLNELFTRIKKEQINVKNPKRLTMQNIKPILVKEFLGFDKEKFMLICVDSECSLISKHTLSIGSETTAMVSIKEIIKYAVLDKARYVFLAHNHPGGNMFPSNADIELTKSVCDALNLVEIPVIEHYIVGKDDVFAIIRNCNIFKEK